MLFFAHAGITAGAVYLSQKLVTIGEREEIQASEAPPVSSKWKYIRDKVKSIDFRLVLIGSLLPDIIDKPVWMLTSNDVPWDGRGYAHSLLLNMVLLLIGIILAIRWKKIWLLTISFGCIMHLILDQIWNNPVAFWWPFQGPIIHEPTQGWFNNMGREMTDIPSVYISELVGLVILSYLALRLILQKNILWFIKTGRLERDGYRTAINLVTGKSV